MPLQKPSSRIISMSYSVRCLIRCASSIIPFSWKSFACSSSSWRISTSARSIVGFDVTYCVAGKHRDVIELREHLAGERVEMRDLLDLVAEERDAVRRLRVRRLDLHYIALDAEAAATEQRVVARVLDVDQLAQHEVPVGLLADRRGTRAASRTPRATRARRCTRPTRRRPCRGARAGSMSLRGGGGRCRRSASCPSRCRDRPAGRTPPAGSSRSRRRSTRPRSPGRTR